MNLLYRLMQDFEPKRGGELIVEVGLMSRQHGIHFRNLKGNSGPGLGSHFKSLNSFWYAYSKMIPCSKWAVLLTITIAVYNLTVIH